MNFLEENILAWFGCLRRIIIDNETTFKSNNMINFCHTYHIGINHSTSYYPQGNGLAESTNKIMVRIIKKLLEDKKRAWHTKSKYTLCADRISTKRAIGMSSFQLVYRCEVVFLAYLGVPVMRLLQEHQNKLDHMHRRINQINESNELRDKAYNAMQT